MYMCTYLNTPRLGMRHISIYAFLLLEIVFENIWTKQYLISKLRIVSGNKSKSREPTLCPFKTYEISTRPLLLLTNNLPCCEVTVIVFYIIIITNQPICPVKCNFVRRKRQMSRKWPIAGCYFKHYISIHVSTHTVMYIYMYMCTYSNTSRLGMRHISIHAFQYSSCM